MASCEEVVSTISGATLEKARKELNEIPEKRGEAIQALLNLINQFESNPDQPDYAFTRKDGKFLLRFLRARKFDAERAFQLYQNYHKYRMKHAHILEDFNAESVQDLLKSGLFKVLDNRLNDGTKVLCIYPARYDIDVVPVASVFKCLLLILDQLIEDEETQVHGISVLDNLEGVSFYHAMKVARTNFVQKGVIVELVQEAFPARFKGIHLIHQPWYANVVYTIVRPFLKQKTKDRIHMHGSRLESLHDYISPELLPADLGGSLPPLEQDCVAKLFPKLVVCATDSDAS